MTLHNIDKALSRVHICVGENNYNNKIKKSTEGNRVAFLRKKLRNFLEIKAQHRQPAPRPPNETKNKEIWNPFSRQKKMYLLCN